MLPKRLQLLSLSKKEIRNLIAQLEKVIISCPQVEIPTVHRFSKGVYSREIKIPKGTFIVGEIHKFENLNILSHGEATVLSIDGPGDHIVAPWSDVSSPGVKRVIYAHEDCTWTTIHGTNERDLEKIKDEVIVKSYDALEG